MGPLRKAGNFIADLDERYSDKIAAMYEGANDGVKFLGQAVGGGMPSFRGPAVSEGNSALEKTLSYALPAVNTVPKYVLPAVGVKLAGKALFDMGVMIGESVAANQQTTGTISDDSECRTDGKAQEPYHRMIELPHDEIMVGRDSKEHRCSSSKSDTGTDVKTFEHEKLSENAKR